MINTYLFVDNFHNLSTEKGWQEASICIFSKLEVKENASASRALSI